MNNSLPLVVDLDGTLVKTDLLFESTFRYLKENKYAFPKLVYWLFHGKATLKEELAKRVAIDISLLPYNDDIIDFIKEEKNKSRHIVLATASHRLYADRIAVHLDIFDSVYATENLINLSSYKKRDRLVKEFGKNGFDYIGNSRDDIPVWQAANKAHISGNNRGVGYLSGKLSNTEKTFSTSINLFQSWLIALRPHQWLKNTLIFIPVLAAHQFSNIAYFFNILLAFTLFSLCASSGYLINDLADLESDRFHPRKRKRPLASGDLPLSVGIISAPLLVLLALSTSYVYLSQTFTIVLLSYFIMSIAYSQYLKSIMGVDAIFLAILYTLRILAGTYACNLVPSFWILGFSMFFFLSLALIKRYAELVDTRSTGITTKTRGRGYYTSDLEIIASLGTAAGYLSVIVLALYIQDPRTFTLYKTPELIWLACPILLFWISRLWIITHRGQMHDDPVLYAITDRVSILSGLLFATVFILAYFL